MPPLLAALLLAGQPAAAAEQAALAQCLDRFIAAPAPAEASVPDFTTALAAACTAEEHAFRAAYVAAATARGSGWAAADGEAYETAFALRRGRRDVYLAARTACARRPR
jgi:hypothetical protein